MTQRGRSSVQRCDCNAFCRHLPLRQALSAKDHHSHSGGSLLRNTWATWRSKLIKLSFMVHLVHSWFRIGSLVLVFLALSKAATYWTTALLSYLLCPILMEFEASGNFTVAARLRTSLRRNAVFYGVYALIMVLLLIILVARGEEGKRAHRSTDASSPFIVIFTYIVTHLTFHHAISIHKSALL